MRNVNNYKGLEYTVARAKTGGMCLNVYDNNTRSYVFASGICRDKQQLLQLITHTKEYYNDILNRCYKEISND